MLKKIVFHISNSCLLSFYIFKKFVMRVDVFNGAAVTNTIVSFIRIVDIEFDMLFVEAFIGVFSKIDTVYEELCVAVVVFIVEYLMEHLMLN